jgi:hypothetical protein
VKSLKEKFKFKIIATADEDGSAITTACDLSDVNNIEKKILSLKSDC